MTAEARVRLSNIGAFQSYNFLPQMCLPPMCLPQMWYMWSCVVPKRVEEYVVNGAGTHIEVRLQMAYPYVTVCWAC